MNYLDIIIAIVLIIFAINGHKNGLIREVFALIAFVGGIYGAILFSDVVGNWLSKIIDVSPDWRDWMPVISFILVFIGLVFLIPRRANNKPCWLTNYNTATTCKGDSSTTNLVFR